jgi:hypothetical protein
MQTTMTSEALKHLIQVRLDALADEEEASERIYARDVQWHARDEDGRNWDMAGYRGPAEFATDVRRTVDRLRRQYSLAEFTGRQEN